MAIHRCGLCGSSTETYDIICVVIDMLMFMVHLNRLTGQVTRPALTYNDLAVHFETLEKVTPVVGYRAEDAIGIPPTSQWSDQTGQSDRYPDDTAMRESEPGETAGDRVCDQFSMVEYNGFLTASAR